MSDAVLKYGEPENYVNRELSWLEFNYRILGEARDKTTPLFERLKFISITSSNLDEFYMVRVASLKDQVHANYTKKDLSGMDAKSKRTLFTSMTSSPESNFWMSTASRSCGNPTCSTPLSVAISRLLRPACWQTASTARISSMVISRAINISSALTPEMQPTTD